MSDLYFYGGATDSQYTFDGNGVSRHNHCNEYDLQSRAPYLVEMELCGHRIADVEAVVDDFGDLVPVTIRSPA